jgi:hypothetical protein
LKARIVITILLYSLLWICSLDTRLNITGVSGSFPPVFKEKYYGLYNIYITLFDEQAYWNARYAR